VTAPATTAPLPDGDVAAPARRPRWWLEVFVIVWLCWVYDDIANLAPLRRQAAYAHARSILHLEHLAHLDPEAALNRWLATHHAIALWVSNYYDNAHFIVTLGVVGWLWWRHPVLYRPLRTSLVLINVVALAVFWFYPTAPPRLLDPRRYVDVVAATHAFGSWHSGTLATAANQLAAMPSLHIAWAAWSSLAAWRILGGFHNRWTMLVWIYPVLTTLAVMATGNHFLIDAVAGLVTTVVCTLIADHWEGWWTARLARRALAAAPASASATATAAAAPTSTSTSTGAAPIPGSGRSSSL
jgi:PAP2 superfamily